MPTKVQKDLVAKLRLEPDTLDSKFDTRRRTHTLTSPFNLPALSYLQVKISKFGKRKERRGYKQDKSFLLGKCFKEEPGTGMTDKNWSFGNKRKKQVGPPHCSKRIRVKK